MSSELDEALSKSGLNFAEYAALFHVSDTVIIPRAMLVRFVAGNPPGNRELTLADAEHGIASCISRGLLIELSAADITADHERWENETRPHSFAATFQRKTGDVDLTVTGFKKYQEISKMLYADYSPPPPAGYNNATTGQIQVLGATEEACNLQLQSVVDMIRSGKFARELKVARTEPPVAIGEWWLSRFELIPSGFQAVIHTSKHVRRAPQAL